MGHDPQDPSVTTVEERQLRAVLGAVAPGMLEDLDARSALATIDLDDGTLDALAMADVIGALRHAASLRDGRPVARLFTRVADRLGRFPPG